MDKCYITRDNIAHIINVVFGDTEKFYDIYESDSAYPRFECLNSVGESAGNSDIYIIDTETKKFIGWYKLYHVGRDFITNMTDSDELKEFFEKFKEYGEKSNE